MKYLYRGLSSIALAFTVITGLGSAVFAADDRAITAYIAGDLGQATLNDGRDEKEDGIEGSGLGAIFIAIGILGGGIIYMCRDKITQ